MIEALNITDNIVIRTKDITITKPFKRGLYDFTVIDDKEQRLKEFSMVIEHDWRNSHKKSTLLFFNPSQFIITSNSNEQSVNDVLKRDDNLLAELCKHLSNLVENKQFEEIKKESESFEKDVEPYRSFETYKEWAKINRPIEARFDDLLQEMYNDKENMISILKTKADYFKRYLETGIVEKHSLSCSKIIDDNGIILKCNPCLYKLTLAYYENECVGLQLKMFENCLFEY
jgi:hypothetical protein